MMGSSDRSCAESKQSSSAEEFPILELSGAPEPHYRYFLAKVWFRTGKSATGLSASTLCHSSLPKRRRYRLLHALTALAQSDSEYEVLFTELLMLIAAVSCKPFNYGGALRGSSVLAAWQV